MITLTYTYALRPFAVVSVDEDIAADPLQDAASDRQLTNFSRVLRVFYALGCAQQDMRPYQLPQSQPDFSSNYDQSLIGKSFDLAYPRVSYDSDDPFNLAPVPDVDPQSIILILENGATPDEPSRAKAPEPDCGARFELTPPQSDYFFGQYSMWQGHQLAAATASFAQDQKAVTAGCSASQAFFEKLGEASSFADDYLTALAAAYANLQSGLEPLSVCLTALAKGDASYLGDLTGTSAQATLKTMDADYSDARSDFQDLQTSLAKKYGTEDGFTKAVGAFSGGMADIATKRQLQTLTFVELDRIAAFLDPKGSGSYDKDALKEMAKYAAFFDKADPKQAILKIEASG